MTERYFEDFAVGQRFETGTYTLDEEELFSFARRYDPQSFHLDVEAASRSLFRGLAASGWHTAAVTIKLLVESDLDIAGGIIGRVIENLEWPRPVRAGDTLVFGVKCSTYPLRAAGRAVRCACAVKRSIRAARSFRP